jgi:hypothetical protein
MHNINPASAEYPGEDRHDPRVILESRMHHVGLDVCVLEPLAQLSAVKKDDDDTRLPRGLEMLSVEIDELLDSTIKLTG